MWKVIVRETCFCEKIQVDYTLSWVFHKYFNFVPMLESRNMDHEKRNCSWDIFCEKLHAVITVSWVFQKYFKFVPMLEWRNVDHMKSNCSDITVSSVYRNYLNFFPMLESRNMDHMKSNCSWDMFLWKKFRWTSQFLEIFKII